MSLTTSTTCRPSSSATSARAREEAPQALEIVEEEIHRFARWLGQLDTLPTVERAARARQRDRRAGAGRERRALGVGLTARPRARRGDRASGDEPAAARADDPPAQPRRGPRPRRLEMVRELFALRRGWTSAGGSHRGRSGGGPRPAPPPRALMRIGTRGSALALAQAGLVAELLGRFRDRPASDERRPRGGRRTSPAGFSSSRMPSGAGRSTSRCTPPRTFRASWPTGSSCWERRRERHPRTSSAEPPDWTGSRPARAWPPAALPRPQLRSAREDLEVVAIRGNVDTRLRKLAEGEFDAIVLARAGLQRLDRSPRSEPCSTRTASCRRRDRAPSRWRARRGRARRARPCATSATPRRSRACSPSAPWREALGASCNTPLGAWAVPARDGRLRMRAWVGLPDGSAWCRDELLGGAAEPEALGREVAARLNLAGAGELLRRAEEMAEVGSA